jgi:hypothetical protein
MRKINQLKFVCQSPEQIARGSEAKPRKVALVNVKALKHCVRALKLEPFNFSNLRVNTSGNI